METITRICCEFFVKGRSIKEIVRDLRGLPQHRPQGAPVRRDAVGP